MVSSYGMAHPFQNGGGRKTQIISKILTKIEYEEDMNFKELVFMRLTRKWGRCVLQIHTFDGAEFFMSDQKLKYYSKLWALFVRILVL